MATLWPLDSTFATLGSQWVMFQSATNRSRRPMATGSPLMPRTHLLSRTGIPEGRRGADSGQAVGGLDDLIGADKPPQRPWR